MNILDEDNDTTMERDTVPEVPVLVRMETPEKAASADLVSFRTITLAGTEAPIRLLALDKKRHRATILVHNPLGVATPAIPPYVFLSQSTQVSANGDARGAAVVAGDIFPIETAHDVWITPAGVAITVSVIEERYV